MSERRARIVVGVSGSIAAWKTCDLVSKLVQQGLVVDVVLTRAATRFVQPLAFAALTHRAAFTDDSWFEGAGESAGAAAHLMATENADLLVVAPCTGNTIGKFAHGIADEILSTTYLGAACPVLIAPAMNTRMWESPRVQANLQVLRDDGVHVVGPETGYLAEGQAGPGRMSEAAQILEAVERLLPSA